jgi:hypothetical protein
VRAADPIARWAGRMCRVHRQGVASSGNSAFRDEGINDASAEAGGIDRNAIWEGGSQLLPERPRPLRTERKFLTIQERVMEPLRVHCGGQTGWPICGGNALVH